MPPNILSINAIKTVKSPTVICPFFIQITLYITVKMYDKPSAILVVLFIVLSIFPT